MSAVVVTLLDIESRKGSCELCSGWNGFLGEALSSSCSRLVRTFVQYDGFMVSSEFAGLEFLWYLDDVRVITQPVFSVHDCCVEASEGKGLPLL